MSDYKSPANLSLPSTGACSHKLRQRDWRQQLLEKPPNRLPSVEAKCSIRPDFQVSQTLLSCIRPISLEIDMFSAPCDIGCFHHCHIILLLNCKWILDDHIFKDRKFVIILSETRKKSRNRQIPISFQALVTARQDLWRGFAELGNIILIWKQWQVDWWGSVYCAIIFNHHDHHDDHPDKKYLSTAAGSSWPSSWSSSWSSSPRSWFGSKVPRHCSWTSRQDCSFWSSEPSNEAAWRPGSHFGDDHMMMTYCDMRIILRKGTPSML